MIRTLPSRPLSGRMSGAAAIVLVAVAGCAGPARDVVPDPEAAAGTPEAVGAAADPAAPIVFTDVTAEAGVEFTHNTGAFGEKYLPETLGAGAIWLDANDDGRQDLLLVNSTDWPGRGAGTPPALYRNDGGWSFTDITRGSGLDVPIYGIGGAAADYDNDGQVDVYLTALGPNRLLRGTGDGAFTDETAAGRRRRSRVLDQRPVVRLRPRRAPRSLRGQLRDLDAGDRSVLHARRRDQVVLHAGVLRRAERDPLPQPGVTVRSRT